MSKQLAIPVDDLRKPDFLEMIRAWIADEGLHCTIKIGIKGKEETIFGEFCSPTSPAISVPPWRKKWASRSLKPFARSERK